MRLIGGKESVRRRSLLFAIAATLVTLVPAPASAHGDLQGTSPEDGSRVKEVPAEITITLTEAPTQGAEVSATDGCKKKVPAAVSVDGDDIVLVPGGGEPGKWKVKYRAVSSVDGHQTRGAISFTVAGKKDCSPDEPDDPGDDIDASEDPGILQNPNPPDEGSSWLLWVGGGTVVLVAAAFFIRRSSR